MIQNKKTDSIHECGHALIAKLFEENFEVKSITLKPDLYSNYINTHNWRGGINFSPTPKTVENPSEETKDKLTVLLLGGLVSQNILLSGRLTIKRNINIYLSNLDLLDYEGCDGDLEKAEGYINEQMFIKRTSCENYCRSNLNFGFNYLLRDKVWETVESLSDLIINKPNLTITNNEIENHYQKMGFTKYILKHKYSILSERYKVSASKKIIHYLRCLAYS